ncbi:MAG: tetratricopeptide repeat protein [Planctomycetota bacterium]
MIHTKKTTLMTLVVGCVVGCARSDYSLSGREQKSWQRVDEKKVAEALPEEPIKILPETFFYAGQLLESQGQTEFAIKQYRKAVAVNHQYGAAYHRLGLLLSFGGYHDEALGHLARAVELRPKEPVFRNNYGYELMFHERWAEAEHEFNCAVEIDPQFVRPYVNRGMTLSKLGRFDEALASFRVVLPESDAYYNVGLMHRGQGQYEEAADAFDRVLAINPLFWAARTQLEQLAPRVEGLRWVQVAEPPLPSDPFESLSPEPQSEMVVSNESLESGDSEANGYVFADSQRNQTEDWTSQSLMTEPSDSPFSGRQQSVNGLGSYWIPTPYALPEDFGIATGPPTFDELVASMSIVRNEIDCLDTQSSEISESSVAWDMSLEGDQFASVEDQACTVPWYLEFASPAWTGTSDQTESSTFFQTESRRPTMGMSVTQPNEESRQGHHPSDDDDGSGDDGDDDDEESDDEEEDDPSLAPEHRHQDHPRDREQHEPQDQQGRRNESHDPRADVGRDEAESFVASANELSIEQDLAVSEIMVMDSPISNIAEVQLAIANNDVPMQNNEAVSIQLEQGNFDGNPDCVFTQNDDDDTAFDASFAQLQTLLSIVENESRCAESPRKSLDAVSMNFNGLPLSTEMHAAIVAMLHRWAEVAQAPTLQPAMKPTWLIQPDTQIPQTDHSDDFVRATEVLAHVPFLPAPLPD